MRWFSYRRLWMLAGFVSAGAGDWFLAVKGAPRASVEFLCGVLCFALAQVCWAAGQLREARPDWRMALALAVPLGVFSGVRLFPVLPPATGVAVCAYAVLTACAFSLAYATRRVFYAWGIGLLCFSDVMIGFGLLRMPGCHALVGLRTSRPSCAFWRRSFCRANRASTLRGATCGRWRRSAGRRHSRSSPWRRRVIRAADTIRS